jgi:multiple sugar transport system permease protein
MKRHPLRRILAAAKLWVPLRAWLTFVLVPYAWMFITSIKPPAELYTKTVRYWPNHPTIEGYRLLIETTPFLTYIRNSGIVAVSTCVVALVVAMAAAYCFSRIPFRGKGILLFGFLVTQLFPSVLLVLPLFLIMRSLGILNTPPALILAHSTFAVRFSAWMLTGSFNAIPRELDEAATIDGYPRPGAKVQFQEFDVQEGGLVATGMAAGGPDGILRVHLGMKGFRRRIRAG